jgi:hypothetical protein
LQETNIFSQIPGKQPTSSYFSFQGCQILELIGDILAALHAHPDFHENKDSNLAAERKGVKAV